MAAPPRSCTTPRSWPRTSASPRPPSPDPALRRRDPSVLIDPPNRERHMQPTSTPPPRTSALRRYGPLVAIVAVIAIVAGIVIATRSSDSSDDAAPATTVPFDAGGALSFTQAKAEG